MSSSSKDEGTSEPKETPYEFRFQPGSEAEEIFMALIPQLEAVEHFQSCSRNQMLEIYGHIDFLALHPENSWFPMKMLKGISSALEKLIAGIPKHEYEWEEAASNLEVYRTTNNRIKYDQEWNSMQIHQETWGACKSLLALMREVQSTLSTYEEQRKQAIL